MANIMHLDLRNLADPQPALKTKALLDGGHKGPLTVGLDNEISASNVANLLKSAGLVIQTYQQGGEWLVLGRDAVSPDILVWHGPDGWQAVVDDREFNESLADPIIDRAALVADLQIQSRPESDPGTVVLIGSQFMGRGDDSLGARLAASFFDTLAAIGKPPRLMAFYNSGVILTTTASPALPPLQELASQGATIISCGVCLEYYQLKSNLKIGRIGNMYEIINAQMTASQVIRF